MWLMLSPVGEGEEARVVNVARKLPTPVSEGRGNRVAMVLTGLECDHKAGYPITMNGMIGWRNEVRSQIEPYSASPENVARMLIDPAVEPCHTLPGLVW
jgi:hypothetical protein